MRSLTIYTLLSLIFLLVGLLQGDELVLKDGTSIKDCFVRDEGVRILVWRGLEEVGGPAIEYPRSHVQSYRIDRPEEWDHHPSLPDLTITYIEMNPKLAGLHGRVNYDKYGRPTLGGGSLPKLPENELVMHPERVVSKLKLKYKKGEEITLTAHVKNIGFVPAEPFEYEWLIDGRKVKEGKYEGHLGEMEENITTVPIKNIGDDSYELLVDLRQRPDDIYWFSQVDRFAVSSVGELSLESELVETLLPEKQK